MATTNKRFVAKNGLDNNNQTITNIGAAGTSLGLSGTGDLTIAISGTATLTIPSGSDTLVTLSGAQTLTNKTISGSNNTLSNIGNGSLTNSSVSFNGVSVALGASGTLYTDDISEDGSPTNKYFTDARARAAISVTDSGGDGSLSYDSGTGVITYTGPSATEVRAHLSAGTGLTYTTGQFAIDNTVVTLTGTQTLENKTLTTPVISAITNTGTLTLPTSTDTLVGRATTDTLSNKTISGASNTISNIGNGSLTNSSITINGTSVSLGGTRTLVTDDIAEDGSPVNLWYTDTRARNAISVTDAGGDGSLSYSSGVITYTGPSASEVRAHFSAGTGVTITSGQVAIGQAVATTDNVTFAGVTADNVRVGVTAAGEIDTSTGNLTIDSAGGTTTIDDDATVTGNLQVDGNLTVSGTTVTVNATNLAIEDNMIYLNNGSTVSHPDLGFAGNYNDGTYRHAGLFRDATDGVWKFFHQYTPEPDASAYIDTSHGSFALAPVQASSFTGSVTGNASTATTWQTARTLSLTGDVTGTSAAFDGSGNISISTTIAADSVALGTDTTGNYVASITNGNYITGGNGGSEGAALTLAVDATSANTASKVVARDASGNFSAGTITAALSGNASTVTNGVYTTDTGTVTNTMLAGSIANNKLANSTISGISLGGNLATLTLDVSGTGLSGSQTYNGSGAATFTVTSNATSANTASTIVARDASGNFTAGTITAALSGNATSSTNSTTTSQRAFSSDISTTGQGRFTGWYNGNAATGLATEAGVYSGQSYLISYNRDTSSYGILNINASTINIDPQGGSLTGPGGNVILHAGNYTSYSTSWANVGSGTRTDYGLDLRPPSSGNYAGFSFSKSTSANGATDAGYFLIRGGTSGDVYTAEGITLVADAGWLTLAQRTTASRGVRIMSGSSTSTERLLVTTAGDIQFVNGNSFTYGGNAILHAGNYNSYSPTLTGTGASGTWSIRVTGFANAGSQRLYSTDAAYNYDSANPYYGYLTYIGANNRWRFQVLPATPAAVEVAYADTAGSAPANGGTSTEVNGSRFSTTASSYVNFYTWAHFHGGTTYGLYFPSSGSMTHMYPSATTYGSFMVDGSRNGYWGAMFSTGVGNAGWMTTGNTTGFYNHTYGWKYYHENGAFYIYSGAYGGGTQYTALHSGNYSSYALPLSGGTLTGTIFVGTSGTGSANRALRIAPSGSSPSSFGSYSGSWRSVIEIWDNAATRMLFLAPPDGTNFNYGFIKSTDAGLRIDVGSGGGSPAITIEPSTTITFAGAATFNSSATISSNLRLTGGGYGSDAISSSSPNGIGRVFAPQGAAGSWDGTQTGAIKIRLPFRANNPMWYMTVKIYNYNSRQISEYKIGNYSYSDGSYNSAATCHADSGAPIHNVRFGNDGSYDCVWIGETSTTWSYPVVAVTDFSAGFRSGEATNTSSNWNISIATSFGTVGGTLYPASNTGYQYAYAYYGNSNVGGTGSASYHPSGIYSLGTNWLYGAMYLNRGNINEGGTIYMNNWFRSEGATGWYNQTYGAGIWMNDSSWVRIYGTIDFYATASIAAVGNVTAYYSDERLKTKTGLISDALSKVMGLNGFFYVENDVARTAGYKNEKQQVGVSAQEVQAILPEAVSLAPFDMHTEEDGTIVSKSGENYLTVDYSRLVPLLIEAIKELKKENEELTTRINKLENN